MGASASPLAPDGRGGSAAVIPPRTGPAIGEARLVRRERAGAPEGWWIPQTGAGRPGRKREEWARSLGGGPRRASGISSRGVARGPGPSSPPATCGRRRAVAVTTDRGRGRGESAAARFALVPPSPPPPLPARRPACVGLGPLHALVRRALAREGEGGGKGLRLPLASLARKRRASRS